MSFCYLWNRAENCPPEHKGNITKAFNQWVKEKEDRLLQVEARGMYHKEDLAEYHRLLNSISRQRKNYNKAMKGFEKS